MIDLDDTCHRKMNIHTYAAGGIFSQHNMIQKRKMTETLAHGYSSESNQQELPK